MEELPGVVASTADNMMPYYQLDVMVYLEVNLNMTNVVGGGTNTDKDACGYVLVTMQPVQA